MSDVRLLPVSVESERDAQVLLEQGYRLAGVDQGVLVFVRSHDITVEDLKKIQEMSIFLEDLLSRLVASDPETDRKVVARMREMSMVCGNCQHFQAHGTPDKDTGRAPGYCKVQQYSTSNQDSCSRFEVACG